ncbi:vWA domain-containing protein [Nocardioides insulae]|uniref:vWA domain-containing protein n=1 Tax=Nocardioides insulae TaxID=394734 RepID=UPI00040716C8|nr:vWA domain-containing protein [Nocardioides insulae]
MTPLLRRPATVALWTLRCLVLLLLVGVLVRPGWGTDHAEGRLSDLDVLVVVDRTRSMAALDQPDGGPRINAAKEDLHALAEELAGSRFSLITFGGDVVRTAMPFSTDLAAYDSLVWTLRLEDPYFGAGSIIDQPLEEMRTRLEQSAEQHPDRRRVVVFVSDGENTKKGAEQRSFAELADVVDAGVVLGYGTESGGPMPVEDDGSGEEVMRDDEGEPILSRSDPDNLARVGADLGIPVERRTVTDPTPIAEITDGFAPTYAAGTDPVETDREFTWLLGLLLLVLVLVEVTLAVRTLRLTRRPAPRPRPHGGSR